MQDQGILFIALVAFLGSLLSALLGWADSGEPFASRKFLKSAITGVLAALGFAVTYSLTGPVQVRDLFFALLGGAGVDVAVNRSLGTLARR